MANAWGDSWGSSWANSWAVVEGVGDAGTGAGLLWDGMVVPRVAVPPEAPTWRSSGTLSAVVVATVGGRGRVEELLPVAAPAASPAAKPPSRPAAPTTWAAAGELTAVVGVVLSGRARYIDRARQLREDAAVIRAAYLGLDVVEALKRG